MSLNVGVLGHVDSGKTTLTRALADMASTAAFDKHAESGGRRNTLDLGSVLCFALSNSFLDTFNAHISNSTRDSTYCGGGSS